MALFSGIHARDVTMHRAALNRSLRLYKPDSATQSRARFEVLVKTVGRVQMRDATVGALSRVPAQARPAVPMATPVDPIFTAIERDRIAYVAFAASLNKTIGRKAAQEKGHEVTQSEGDAHEDTSGVGDDAFSEPTDDGVWRQR